MNDCHLTNDIDNLFQLINSQYGEIDKISALIKAQHNKLHDSSASTQNEISSFQLDLCKIVENVTREISPLRSEIHSKKN